MVCISLSKTKDDFLNKYREELKEFRTSALYRDEDDPHHYATFAYDAVWTMALALHRADADLQSVPSLSVCVCVCVCVCVGVKLCNTPTVQTCEWGGASVI